MIVQTAQLRDELMFVSLTGSSRGAKRRGRNGTHQENSDLSQTSCMRRPTPHQRNSDQRQAVAVAPHAEQICRFKARKVQLSVTENRTMNPTAISEKQTCPDNRTHRSAANVTGDALLVRAHAVSFARNSHLSSPFPLCARCPSLPRRYMEQTLGRWAIVPARCR